jgi:UDP-N-acetyl-D-mannosaminuronate dehydrogenase
VTNLDADVRLSMLGRQVNEALPRRAALMVAEEVASRIPADRVAKGVIMGLAFKGRPETSDLRGTLAIPLIAELRALYPNARLYAYDPAVPSEDAQALGVQPCATAEEAFRDAAFVIYQNNNAAFSRLNLGALSRLMQQDGVIYDMWNQYLDERSHLRPDVAYFGLGTRLFATQRLAAARPAANDG